MYPKTRCKKTEATPQEQRLDTYMVKDRILGELEDVLPASLTSKRTLGQYPGHHLPDAGKLLRKLLHFDYDQNIVLDQTAAHSTYC